MDTLHMLDLHRFMRILLFNGKSNMGFPLMCVSTWEGDNNILTLQAGRYLIGCYRESKQGIKQAPGVHYLNIMDQLLKARCLAKSIDQMLDLDMIGNAYWAVAAHVVKKAGEDFAEYSKRGMKEDEAYEECSSARSFAAKIHSYGYLFHRFKDGIKKVPAPLLSVLKVCSCDGILKRKVFMSIVRVV